MVLQSLKSMVRIGLITLPILLSACGGGGGSSSSGKGPVITLVGESEITQGYGRPYEELGASATDEVDGEVDVSISGEVDISTIGQYFVTYTATDSEGHKTQIQRTVNIVDATAPVISLQGGVFITIVRGRDEYVEQGATAEDFIDGIVSVDIGGDVVNTNAVGEYTVTYTAQDSAGNKNSVDVVVTVREPLPLVTIWKTDNAGFTGDNKIKITTDPSYEYKYTVVWGDGFGDEDVTGDIIHTYNEAGEYQIKIYGDFPAIVFPSNQSDPLKIIKVEEWGETEWQTLDYAFDGCENLTIEATDNPDLSKVTSLNYTFREATSLEYGVKDWDVSTITEMNGTFSFARIFKDDISSWNVSSVISMEEMFRNADLFNHSLNIWDVSNVTNMKGMFEGTASFNQDLSDWDVSSVENMEDMFAATSSFNQNINTWDVSNVKNMSTMFAATSAFNQPLSDWDVSNVTDMNSMFHRAYSFNQPLNDWDLSSLEDMRYMFARTRNFNQDLNDWNMPNVDEMTAVFYEAAAFNGDISSWDTSNVTNMPNMFFKASSFNQDISNWNTENVTNMEHMFYAATYFNADIGGWDVSNVRNFGAMFGLTHYFNQDLGSWDVSSAQNMLRMFTTAIAFDQDISGWNVSNVYYMIDMLSYSGMSSENYSKLLNAWSEQSVRSNVKLGASGKQYAASVQAARDKLVNTYNWEITDGGLVTP